MEKLSLKIIIAIVLRYIFSDGHTWDEASTADNQLETIFKDGKMIREQSLADIRSILHNGMF